MALHESLQEITHQLSFCVSGAMARSTFCFSAHMSVRCIRRDPVDALLWRGIIASAQWVKVLTKIVDVEDATNGAARSTMLDLGLGRRGRGVIDGRVDLAEGLGDDVCGHGW